jgi:hypothetical protein
MRKLTFIVLAITAFLAGCDIYRTPEPMADYFYLNPQKNLVDIGKVVLVQLENKSNYPEIAPDATQTLFEELQKKQIFSLRVVSDADTQWRSLQLDLHSSYTIEQLVIARNALRCDAIIIGTITQYSPYPHQIIGLNLKMISLDDGQLVWAFEQIWDTSDKKLEYRIKKYLQNQSASKSDIPGERLIRMSTIKFLKFVAYEVASTL